MAEDQEIEVFHPQYGDVSASRQQDHEPGGEDRRGMLLSLCAGFINSLGDPEYETLLRTIGDSASLMRVPESQLKKLWATVESLATPYVSLIKAFLTKQRAMLKPENQLKLVAQREKERVKALKTLEKETLALAKPHLKVMEICLSHTRKVLKLGK
jgi:hypothetical protein